VLQPLGLESARVPEGPDDVADAATPHGTDGEPVPFFLSDHPGAADLFISAEDLARFGLFHLGALQASRPVIGAESRAAMQQPGLGGYGFGWSVNPDWRGRRVVWNSGAKPGGAATLWLVPSERIVIALVGNQIGAPVNQFAGEILGSLLDVDLPAAAAPGAPDEAPGAKPAPPPPPTDLLGRWAGSVSSCPQSIEFSLEIRSPSDLSGDVGRAGPQIVQGAAARGRRVSGTLKGDAEAGPSTFQFDLEVQGDRLEGAIVRRTPLGPRGNNAVTMWAVLTRQK
jgi:CubicO group peptidase (beta-lactamase class C family)